MLPGDGIGPEVTRAATKVLQAVQEALKDTRLQLTHGEAGYACITKYGTNLPQKTIDLLKESDACLKGPMTTPEEPGSPTSVVVKIRRMFDLYANVRPCMSLPGVASLSHNIDLVIVRENTEDLYSGIEFEVSPGNAVALRIVTEKACSRIAEFAFKLAAQRRRHLTYVHKGNILKITDGIFKDAIKNTSRKYPEVVVEELRVDAAAMQLIKRPESFDVVVTTNLFGDILSDEAAQTVGGLGFAPGANMGVSFGMFEPIHGSAPKYTGENKANPTATILAASMMLEYLDEKEAAVRIRQSVISVLKERKVRTCDIGGSSGTDEMGEAVAASVKGL